MILDDLMSLLGRNLAKPYPQLERNYPQLERNYPQTSAILKSVREHPWKSGFSDPFNLNSKVHTIMVLITWFHKLSDIGVSAFVGS